LSRSCEGLHELAESHRRRLGEDGFFVFLKVHECICRRVADTNTPALVELNDKFVEACLETYDKFVQNKKREVHRDWVWAYRIYKRNPFDISAVLPFLAMAHILVDLEAVLAQVENIQKSDFDAVFPHISRCIVAVGRGYGIGNPVAGLFRAFTERSAPQKTSSLGFRIFLAIAWVPPIRDYGVRKIRDYAWHTAMARRNLGPMY
jgi:hypothetical protein